jgi:hypothetical protein
MAPASVEFVQFPTDVLTCQGEELARGLGPYNSPRVWKHGNAMSSTNWAMTAFPAEKANADVVHFSLPFGLDRFTVTSPENVEFSRYEN